MNIINMPYKKPFLIDENANTKQRVFFEKTRFNAANVDQYFIKIFKILPDGKYVCQGYIYFYIDFLIRESKFIGQYTNPEFRNEELGQLLISYWIKLCFDNGIYKLDTIHKQRKPFIIYLLKKFKFDLYNIQSYEESPNTISICQNPVIVDKCLYFKNPKQAETFKNGKVHAGDNYFILENIDENTTILDQVLLSTPYQSTDDELAYERSSKLIRTAKEK